MNNKKNIVIRLSNLNKSFNHNSILNDINLEINQGESVVILGESGCGKSVLLKLLLGFEHPDSGSIRVCGKKINKDSNKNLEIIRKYFAVVFQNSAIFDSLSIKENVLISEIVNKKLIKSDSDQKVYYLGLMKSVGLDSLEEDKKPSELSGGMKKRLAIARALASEADIFIYDEPTTGLDPITGEKISDLIRNINDKNPEKNSIVVTHDYYCATKVADIIYYLDKNSGKIIQLLTKKQLNKFRMIDKKIIYLRKKIDEFHTESNKCLKKNCNNSAGKNKFEPAITFLERIGNLFFLLFRFGLPYRFKDVSKKFVTLGIQSLPLIIIIGFFIGMLITLQFYTGVESFKQFADLKIPKTISENLLILFSPILTGLLLSGKVGTLITSEIGSKNYLEQINALKSLSICPERFLLAPIYFSLLISVPVLVFTFSLSGIIGGFVVWISFGESGQYYSVISLEGVLLSDLLFVLIKSMIIASLISLISYQLGIEKKTSTEDVSSSTTEAFIYCSIFIIGFELVSNYLYTLL